MSERKKCPLHPFTFNVRDGHHHISVARAFGEEYIDAQVIVLELNGAGKSMVKAYLQHFEYAAT